MGVASLGKPNHVIRSQPARGYLLTSRKLGCAVMSSHLLETGVERTEKNKQMWNKVRTRDKEGKPKIIKQCALTTCNSTSAAYQTAVPTIDSGWAGRARV